MDFFYLFCLLLGGYIVFYILRQRFKISRGREKSQHSNVKSSELIDVRLVIIKNHKFLNWLYTIDQSFMIKVRFVLFLSVIIFIILLAVSSDVTMSTFFKVCLINFLIITIMPLILIPPIVSGEMKKIKNAVPFFIDLVAVCVQTGLTVESSIQFIADKFSQFNINMASLMDIVMKKSAIIGFEDAIHRLYLSVTIPEMKMFCSSLRQSVHYGTPLYENLMELSKDVRINMILESEEKIGKLSAKMSIPLILLIMFPITILIIAPGLLRILQNAGI
ncbi:type II secretion system F family protein [Salmonella enterica subsp. enterica serovar Bonariensis]|nr:type II secretion system F family protein [Salmonella enterica subsp. enterica serovar Bonariensis]EBI1757437.1 type II secretion system F family protein [Salmonella enterica]EBU0529544.1 type II secretion system F family protein [Salmonella enterica]EBU3699917.1 type II secretion system F family protein [Salmonella enterica]ECR9771350.1 type II secretion system F family protein [Salmonella enterica]